MSDSLDLYAPDAEQETPPLESVRDTEPNPDAPAPAKVASPAAVANPGFHYDQGARQMVANGAPAPDATAPADPWADVDKPQGDGWDDVDHPTAAALPPGAYVHGQVAPNMDAYRKVGNAFMQGLGDGWTGGQIVQPGLQGLPPELSEGLAKWASYPDVKKGQETAWQSFNEAFTFPAVQNLAEIAARNARLGLSVAQIPLQAGAALTKGALEASLAAGVPRDIVGMAEYELQGAGVLAHIPHPSEPIARPGLPVEPEPHPAVTAFRQEPEFIRPGPEAETGGTEVRRSTPITPDFIEAARREGIIGPTGEWDGTSVYASGRPDETANEPMDIHGVARQIDPETLEEYDRLRSVHDMALQEFQDETARAQSEVEASAPHADEIADIQDSLQNPNISPRNALRYQQRLSPLIQERDAYLANQDLPGLVLSSPENMQLRNFIADNAQRLQAIEPRVRDVYAEAASRMPPEEVGQETTSAAPEPDLTKAPEIALDTDRLDSLDRALDASDGQPVSWTSLTDAERADFQAQGILDADGKVSYATVQRLRQERARRVRGEPTPAQAPEASEAAAPVDVASDVSEKMRAAGRSPEEADAFGTLVGAFFDTWAAREGGNAADLYRDNGPDIVGRAIGPRGASGSLSRVNGRSILTLFAKADPSTAIHELGHFGTQTVLRIAADPNASEGVKGIARTIREWVGAPEGADLTRNQHERVARGLEAYFRTGTAPSARLATVFGQFRDWIQQVYDTFRRRGEPINDQIKGVFDQWFARPEEKPVIAPEEGGPPGKPRTIGIIMRDERVRESVARQIQSQELIAYSDWQSANRNAGTNAIPAATRAPVPGERPRAPRSEAQIIREDRVSPARARQIWGEEITALADWQAAQRAAGKPTVETERPAPAGSISPEEAQRIAREMLKPPEPEAAPLAVEPEPAAPAPEPEPVVAKNFGPPVKPPPLKAYQAVPREPKRLIRFLKEGVKVNEGTASERVEQFGLRDEGGDLAAILGGTKFRRGPERGLINNRDGEALDHARERAVEAGYFPQGDADIQDLKDAISEDLNGQPARYSMHDDDAVHRYEQAVAHNREIDRMAAEAGIDPRGMTLDAFVKAYEDAVSPEAFDREEISQRARSIDADNQLRGDLQEWENIPNAAEEVDAIPLEDIEREWREAEATQGVVAGPEGGEQPGVSGGPEGPGAGVDGGVGNDAGDAGSPGETGAAATGESGGPDAKPEPFPASQPSPALAELKARRRADIPKIANVRLEYIDEERWDDLAREVAGQLELSGDPRVQEGSIKAITLHAINNAALDGWDKAKQAWQAAPGPENLIEMERAKGRAAAAFENLSAGLTDWGKTGNQWQKIIRASKRRIADIAAGNPDDMTLFQRQQQLELLDSMSTPEQVGHALSQDYLSPWDKFRNGLMAFYLSNILSGPVTHGGYLMGGVLTNLTNGLVTMPTQVGFDIARSVLTGADRTVTAGEIPAYFVGLMSGAMRGVAPALRALQTGNVEMAGIGKATLPYEQQILPNLLGGWAGYALETPLRAIRAIHVLNYSVRFTGEISRLAYRSALAEAADGASSIEIGAGMQRYMNDIPPEDMALAHDEAIRSTLMKRPPPGSLGQKVSAVIDATPGGRFIAPFPQIGMNLAEEGLVRTTPLGLLSADVRSSLAQGGAAQTVAAGRMIAGTAMATGVIGLALNGLITGPGPDEATESGREQARVLKDQGWAPYSFRFGDTYVPFRKGLGQIGELFGMSATVAEGYRSAAAGQTGEAFDRLARGFGETVADETWLRGVHDLFEAATHPDDKLQYYLTNIATNFIPLSQFNSQMARQIDPDMRVAHGLAETAQSKIPFLSEGLHPVIGPWGQPVTPHSSMGWHTLQNDPVNARLLDLGMGVKPFERDLKGIPMDEAEQEQYDRRAGTLAHQLLLPMVSASGFSTLPRARQMKQIEGVISYARNQASLAVQAQSYDKFIVGGMALKQRMLTSGKPPPTPYMH